MSRAHLKFWIEAVVLLFSSFLILILFFMWLLKAEEGGGFIIRFLRDPIEASLYKHSGPGGDWVKERFNLGIEDWIYCKTHLTTCCTLANSRFCKI